MEAASSSARGREVRIGDRDLQGTLTCPPATRGLVIFAHGSGSSRFSPRNTYVAEALNKRGLGTLLFDLLSDAEARDRRNVFDIPFLSHRVTEAIQWARRDEAVASLPLGLFGASTGAAAALMAAAEQPGDITAVVSRGGRPDLVERVLDRVRAPTLLIVGGADHEVLRLNEAALEALRTDKHLHVVAGATHLFEEPGALDEVVAAAGDWFTERLGGKAA
ncbi:MAG: dienelactone hydrolase family protein [Halofilum sp. (in: g-proteobacteria)]